MPPETVSVIVPTYNSGLTIERCLDALLNQDYPGLEIIVVDDASADATLQKVSRYPVKLFTKAINQGVSHSRNLGAENANSEIFVFVDSDVVACPRGISNLVELFREKPGILAAAGVYSSDYHGLNFISDFKNLDLAYRQELAAGYVAYLGTHFFALKKPTFAESGGFSTEFKGATAEDLDFGVRLTKGKPLMFLDRDIKVVHLKKYGLFTMLKTDFYRIVNMMKIVKVSGGRFKATEQPPLSYLLNPMLAVLFVVLAVIGIKSESWWPVFLATLAFIVNNSRFLAFLSKTRNVGFAVKSALVLLIESACAAASICISFFLPVRKQEASV